MTDETLADVMDESVAAEELLATEPLDGVTEEPAAELPDDIKDEEPLAIEPLDKTTEEPAAELTEKLGDGCVADG